MAETTQNGSKTETLAVSKPPDLPILTFGFLSVFAAGLSTLSSRG
jgi:hypothetical protein